MEESFFINKCIHQVEEKSLSGQVKYWKNQEFEILSEKIAEASGILISAMTLKRLFGKIDTHRSYKPQLETKNALAIYLGYTNWDHFKSQNKSSTVLPHNLENIHPVQHPRVDEIRTNPAISSTVNNTNVSTFNKSRFKKLKWILAFSIGLLILGYAYQKLIKANNSGKITEADSGTNPVFFSADKTQGTIPFTPRFKFDLSKIKADSIFITYGDNIKELIPKNKSSFAYTYLLPNYYKAKLIADNKIIATLPVHATNTDWTSIIFYSLNWNAFPITNPKIFKGNGMLFINPDYIKSLGIGAVEYFVVYRLVREFNADGDNFAIESRVINQDSSLAFPFNNAEIEITGEHGSHKVKFTRPGLGSKTHLTASEILLSGKLVDLSMFERKMWQWNTIRLEVKNKALTVLFNKQQVYRINYQKSIGKIKSIGVVFKGSGGVDYVKLFNAQSKLIYSNDF